jgi:hypothetical protein
MDLQLERTCCVYLLTAFEVEDAIGGSTSQGPYSADRAIRVDASTVTYLHSNFNSRDYIKLGTCAVHYYLQPNHQTTKSSKRTCPDKFSTLKRPRTLPSEPLFFFIRL